MIERSDFSIVTDRNAIDDGQWEQFVREHPRGNILQMPRMFDTYAATPRYHPLVVACFECEKLLGILVALVQTEYDGLLEKLSARSIIWGGPLAYSDEVVSELLSHYNRMVKSRAVYSQVRNLTSLDAARRTPFEKNGFAYEEHLNILVDLHIGMEGFWRGIKSNRKDGINKAKKQGFTFEVTGDPIYLEVFYRLLKETYRDIRMPFPDLEFFVALNKKMPGSVKWFILKKNEEPIIVLNALADNKILRAFYIGSSKDPAILNLRPTDIFHYHVIRWAIENGYETYDWMGAGKPNEEYGVRKFKLQYGGGLIEMGRFEKVHKPVTLQISKIGFWCWRKFRR